jgi:hypothetical protein
MFQAAENWARRCHEASGGANSRLVAPHPNQAVATIHRAVRCSPWGVRAKWTRTKIVSPRKMPNPIRMCRSQKSRWMSLFGSAGPSISSGGVDLDIDQ